MNIVVSDASPINYLVLINAAEILPRLFSTVLVPRVVWEKELQHPEASEQVRAWSKTPAPWISIQDPAVVPELGLGSRGDARYCSGNPNAVSHPAG